MSAAKASPDRALPVRRNPELVAVEETVESLIRRRRLSQTSIAPRDRNAEADLFDFVHLRAPLPANLVGTKVHVLGRDGEYPTSYFLMRRCDDGFVSATGLFKVTFPWASLEEETKEKRHIRTLGKKLVREHAGNVWVDPIVALDLSEEYGMTKWVVALLSAGQVLKSNRDRETKIAAPPVFEIPRRFVSLSKGTSSTPTAASTTPKGEPAKREAHGSTVEASPGSVGTQPHLTPRAESVSAVVTPAATPSKSANEGEEEEAEQEDGEEDDDGRTEAAAENDHDGAEIESEAEGEEGDDVEYEVNEEAEAEVEADSGDDDTQAEDFDPDQSDDEKQDEDQDEDVLFAGEPASAEEVQQRIAEAQRMAAEGREHDRIARLAQTGPTADSKGPRTKRKAVAQPDETDENEADERPSFNPFKRLRFVSAIDKNESAESMSHRQSVKKRALFGLAATLVVGAVLPYIS